MTRAWLYHDIHRRYSHWRYSYPKNSHKCLQISINCKVDLIPYSCHGFPSISLEMDQYPTCMNHPLANISSSPTHDHDTEQMMKSKWLNERARAKTHALSKYRKEAIVRANENAEVDSFGRFVPTTIKLDLQARLNMKNIQNDGVMSIIKQAANSNQPQKKIVKKRVNKKTTIKKTKNDSIARDEEPNHENYLNHATYTQENTQHDIKDDVQYGIHEDVQYQDDLELPLFDSYPHDDPQWIDIFDFYPPDDPQWINPMDLDCGDD